MNDLRRWMKLCETAHDGDAYFDLNDVEANAKSRETLTYMSPGDFLLMAEEGHDPDKMRGIIDLVKNGTKFNSTPVLLFTHDGKGLAQVIGHEGRHRARVLQALGVEEMPVILKSIGGRGREIRWGSQNNPIDKVPVMPTRLRGQDGRATIPMPQSVLWR